jgi:hypothetical protein
VYHSAQLRELADAKRREHESSEAAELVTETQHENRTEAKDVHAKDGRKDEGFWMALARYKVWL